MSEERSQSPDSLWVSREDGNWFFRRPADAHEPRLDGLNQRETYGIGMAQCAIEHEHSIF